MKRVKIIIYIISMISLTCYNLSLRSDIYSLENKKTLNEIKISNLKSNVNEQKEVIETLSNKERVITIAKQLGMNYIEKKVYVKKP